MMWVASIIIILLLAIILYHHIVYPVILKNLAKSADSEPSGVFTRYYNSHQLDELLPSVTLIMPAYNEEKYIADKIRNLATLDYPANKLHILVFCDGCKDQTANCAMQAFAEPECKHLHYTIIDNSDNQGKIAVLNQAISKASSEIIGLTDVSALLSVDGLLIAMMHFLDEKIGVVSATYKLLKPANAGEELYWSYQTSIKQHESALGAPMGVHGAAYFFRKNQFTPMQEDTINDDFILPLSIVKKGFKAIYEPNIVAVELEKTSDNMEQERRIRIASGNAQQLWRLRHLGHPKFKGTSFIFLSGKFLRVLMPFCFILIFIISLIASFYSRFYFLFLILQVLGYLTVFIYHYIRRYKTNKIYEILYYCFAGHFFSFYGVYLYLTRQNKKRW